jgi:hypothetical protein
MLGKLLTVLGLALLIGGIVGSRLAFTVPDVNLDVEATAAELCQPGETLVAEQGASSYTPGQGSGRPTVYYCVDDAGNRRDVTGEFVEGLFGQVTGLIPGFMSGIGVTLITSALTTVGAVLLVIGLILTFTRRTRSNVLLGAQVVGITPQTLDSLRHNQHVTTVIPGVSGSDLSARLRQLDEARKAGLITQDEYDRLRQQLLDSLQ